MCATSTANSPPQTSDCRRRLIDAAAQDFCRDGFHGASVDRIAAAAGVAKQTVYNHFPGKEALFEETIRFYVHEVAADLDDVNILGDIRARLLALGYALRQRVLSQRGLEWYRMVISELSSMSKLRSMAWRQGTLEAQRHLANFLAAAMDKGELRRDDPAFAAEMLSSMLISFDRTRGLLADLPPLDSSQKRIENIINCFLRAYQPD
jgi:TetR/AcrR family transcriptional repressor of mexJK operon